MSKQYAHLHTMDKTSVKFQNGWPKTVGGVAFTRHPLTIIRKKKSEIYVQTICKSSDPDLIICEVSKLLA